MKSLINFFNYKKDKKRISKTFQVSVEYPKVKEIKVSLNVDKVYTGTYLPITYEVIDEMGFVRNDVNFDLNSSDGILEIDPINNIKAIKAGNTTLEATFEGITGRLNIEVIKNPVLSIKLTSNNNQLRTGDVAQLSAIALDKKGNEVSDIPFEFTFKGKSYDKSNTASGLINNEGLWNPINKVTLGDFKNFPVIKILKNGIFLICSLLEKAFL